MFYQDLKELESFVSEAFQASLDDHTTASGGVGCPLHGHEALELFHVFTGSVEFSIDGTSYTLCAGATGIVNPNELHRSVRFSTGCKYACIKIGRAMIDSSSMDIAHKEYISPLFAGKVQFVNFILEDAILEKQISNILICFREKHTGWEMEAKAYFYLVIARLYAKYIHVSKKMKNAGATRDIKLVVDYINHHFDEDITLFALAKIASCCPAHLCRLFRSHTGYSPMAYLNIVRCEHARSLLGTGELTVSQVAIFTGYNNPNYFARVFKQLQGFPPSACKIL